MKGIKSKNVLQQCPQNVSKVIKKPLDQNKNPLKQCPNNPEKNNKQLLDKKLPKKKITLKKQSLKAEQIYQQEILQYVIQSSKQNIKKFKSKTQIKQYKILRSGLLEFMYKQCSNFEMKRKTFFLSVYYLDSFMKTESSKKMSNQDIVYYSYAAFLMAQKYQEIYPPSISQWLPSYTHNRVYKNQGKILFALNFKLIYQSLQSYFDYWCQQYQLSPQQIQNCHVVLDSIVFNFDFLYKYQPQKLAKAVVLMQISQNIEKYSQKQTLNIFNLSSQKDRICQELTNHIYQNRERISWIQQYFG